MDCDAHGEQNGNPTIQPGRGRVGAEILFSGADRGIDDGIEHYLERSLPVKEALRDDVLLVHETNDQPLPPQYGYPLRLIVPATTE